MYTRSQTERLIFKLIAIQLMKSHSRSTVFIGHSSGQGLVDMLLRNCANTCYDSCTSGLLVKTTYENISTTNSTNAYLAMITLQED